MAIDPSPCFGDPTFDAATWCYAYGRRFPAVENAISVFSDYLDLPVDHLQMWTAVLGILNLPRRVAYGHDAPGEIDRTLTSIEGVVRSKHWQRMSATDTTV